MDMEKISVFETIGIVRRKTNRVLWVIKLMHVGRTASTDKQKLKTVHYNDHFRSRAQVRITTPAALWPSHPKH